MYISTCSQGVTLYADPIKSTVHLASEAKILLNSMRIVHENSTFNFAIDTFFVTVRLIEHYANNARKYRVGRCQKVPNFCQRSL